MKQQNHFLLVTFPFQGHINPARHLARRLSLHGARVTISTGISAYRRMFPSSTTDQQLNDNELISYAAFSDGLEDSTVEETQFITRFKLFGCISLSNLITTLSTRGLPVTCVIYTTPLTWAADVASNLSIPSVVFCVQSATVFTIFHHYFHGFADLINEHSKDPSFTLNLPSLPPLQIKDLPVFLTHSHSSILSSFKDMFKVLDSGSIRPKVLINSFDSLEPHAILAVEGVDLVPIGPTGDDFNGGDIFDDDPSGYIAWLDSQKDKSCVYVSFGSVAVVAKPQLEEISKGLEKSGRPYIWVLRKDFTEKVGELSTVEGGMVIEWCNQVRVLSHRSIGCFVTHCGWNSTMESIRCGVPMVMLPQGVEQTTNARLAEKEWGIGVRAEVNEEGVVDGSELKRCLDVVMEDEEIRKNVEIWKEEAGKAVGEGGSSDRNLRAFVNSMKGNSEVKTILNKD